jgi:hypothetical protein
MIVERQGAYECALSTMAALLAVPLTAVRATASVAARRAGERIDEHVTLRALANDLDPSGHLLMLCGGFPEHGDTTVRSASTSTGGTVSYLSRWTRVLPKVGRGTASFHWRETPETHHIMPWEDGLLYDPESPETPWTLDQYRALHSATLDRLTLEVRA